MRLASINAARILVTIKFLWIWRRRQLEGITNIPRRKLPLQVGTW